MEILSENYSIRNHTIYIVAYKFIVLYYSTINYKHSSNVLIAKNLIEMEISAFFRLRRIVCKNVGRAIMNSSAVQIYTVYFDI